MNNRRSLKIWFAVMLLLAVAIVLGQRTFADNNNLLRVVALNIGQGDSIYIEAPNGAQMLIDGGPDHSIIRELGEVMPFGDNSIDVIVVTNPDKDHIGGFIDVLENYDVGLVLEPGTNSSTEIYKQLEDSIEARGIKDIVARKGMKITLDSQNEVSFNVLFPDRDVSNWTTNDGSIVGKIIYGDTSFMMTGDATAKTEGIILGGSDKNEIKSTVLKAGHHGSRTSSSVEFVSAVAPAYALISDGKNNKYGHPHQETLDTLNKFGAKILRTDLLGTIIFKSDGVDFIKK